ncbi:eukaryotic mitochondrial regulator protein-domain-containing protein [Xylaria nigripes]|nr:eukaryotic mitochondrial regulator protein-domain-containing protein [Xylaria nigripes]
MPPLIPSSATVISPVIKASASTARWVAHPSQIPAVASFSTTASRSKTTKARRLFRQWEATEGHSYRRPIPGQTQYLTLNANRVGSTDRPFPLNPFFKSPKVLDDQSRELIWQRVVKNGEAIKAVSAEFGVDIRRVAAIVRLKEVEKEWVAKGKTLAKPYARALMGMLPTHRIKADQANTPFEPINELHVHPFTMQQIFWPTSESRHFTREDAAKAFHPKLLSPDKRVPHPELIQMERDISQDVSPHEASERFKQRVIESEREAAQRQIAKATLEEQRTTRVNTERFEFRFKDYNSEDVGFRGKSRRAIGWRYGAPLEDRSKAHELHIPKSVP